MTDDPYVDPTTGALRNLLGITDAEELAQAEADAFLQQLARSAGWHLAGEHLDAERNVRASIAGFHGDEAPLREMLDQLVEPVSSSPGRDS